MASDKVLLDSSEVEALERVFGVIAPKELQKSLRRALSRTRTNARTETSKQVRETYNVQAARLRRDVILTRPNYREMSFRVIGRKKPIGLTSFRGKGGPARQTKAGVSVAVKLGERSVIRRAFIARNAAGATQVFTRRMKNGRMSPRLPIRTLRGPSAADMMVGSNVVEHLGAIAQERFVNELNRNLKYLLGR